MKYFATFILAVCVIVKQCHTSTIVVLPVASNSVNGSSETITVPSVLASQPVASSQAVVASSQAVVASSQAVGGVQLSSVLPSASNSEQFSATPCELFCLYFYCSGVNPWFIVFIIKVYANGF